MQNKHLFIHIPKCGGSTFVRTLEENLNTDLACSRRDMTHHTKRVKDVLVKHIDFGDPMRPITSPDIFKNFELYGHLNIFTIVRDPVDRLISEYIFQSHILGSRRCARKIQSAAGPQGVLPKTFHEYIKHPSVWNYQVGFLSGHGIGDTRVVTEADLANVLGFFKKYPVYAGTTDQYSQFIAKFNEVSGYDLTVSAQMKKAPDLVKREILNEISQETRDFIYKTNSLDHKLYLYVKTPCNQR